MRRTAVSKKPATLAKLTRPRLYAAFPRERLFRLLDGYHRCPVLWIVGPPGAGKTMLTATWLDTRKLPGLWYQVDPGDADPATFFFYLREAAASLAARRKTPLPLLTPEYLPDLPGFSRRWFRELFARLPRPVTLVLDNYQEVPEESAFHRVIEAAANEIPEGTRLIVVSRAEPPTLFARLQASERLGLVEWDDLRLTLDEARGIAAGKDALGDEIIRELHHESDGWAAGFTLMRERTRRTGLVNRVGEAETMETIFNYFASQIFNDSSAENRDVLIRTAFLPRVTTAQAEAISGNANAGKLLHYLYRRHLFTDRRAGKDQVSYQYHALFQAFLQAQAKQFYTALGLAQLRQRAATLLEAGGQTDDAVALYLEAEDWQAAATLILKHAAGLVAQGRGQTLREWIAALPQEQRDSTPWLTYWAGAALIGVNLREARQTLEQGYEGLLAQADKMGQLMAAAGVLETFYLELDDFKPSDKWIEVVWNLLNDNPQFPSLDIEARIHGATLATALWRNPGHPIVALCLDRTAALLEMDLSPPQKVDTGSHMLWFCNVSGQLDRGSRTIEIVEPELRKPSVPPLARALWLTWVGYIYSLGALHDSSHEAFEAALAIATEQGFAFLLTLIYGAQAERAILFGELDLATQILEKKQAALRQERSQALGRYHVVRAELDAARGRWDEAVRHAETAYAIAVETGAAVTQNLVGHRLALVLLGRGDVSRGDLERAKSVCDRILELFPTQLFPRFGGLAHVSHAFVLARLGQSDKARDLLAPHLRAFKDHGLLMQARSKLFLDHMCHLALQLDVEVEYVRQVIRVNRIRPDSPDILNWPWPIKIHTLGQFVLRLDDQPVEFARKAPKKPLDLLKALIAFGGRNVAAETLANTLWPDAEADAADSAMAVALLRLRKLVDDEGAIVLRDGKLSLDDHRVWVDVWSLERQLDALEATLRDPAKDDAEPGKIGQQVLALYPGHFLAAEADQPWMLPLRERLRTRVLRLTLALGRNLEEARRWDDAQSLYQRGIELDNLAEEFYRRLMTCHRERGEQAEALNVYRRCREMLSVVLGVKPSAETEVVHRSVTG